ncbi:unnamed protein product [Effrenium voratum]|uniref:NFD4 C-terminal domain-containing protein n=1 Tax=Effrenium voratum TaxID=2562239 RepID=A0AA36MKY3_9DINO|nr:unnamed protein product [Effrenium voratum]CAJ1423921.1 unnamed protein product [Effrenium voratum]
MVEGKQWPERRWDLWASAVALNMAAGCAYDYSAFSPAIKETFGLTLRETDLVFNFSWFFYSITCYGYSICNQRLGPKRAPRLGCCAMLACNVLIVYNLLHPILPGSGGAALMTLLMGLAWAGQGTSLGACYQRVMQVFPQTAGVSIGVLKASLGTGGAVAPALFFGLWGSRPPGNFLGMQLFPAFTSLSLGATIIAFTFCVGAEPGYSRTEKRRIHSTALAIIFTTAAATASSLCPVGAMSTALLVLTLVLLLALFLSIACAGDEMSTLQGSSETSDSSDDMHITVQQACQTIEFWMYISVYCISAGSGQLILTNLAQIATVIGFPHQCQALLCCFSTCNMLGRLLFGAICDMLQRRRASRTLLFVLTNFLAAIGQMLFFAAATSQSVLLLFAGALVVGLAFGGTFPTLVNVCAARWGRSTLSANWTFMDAVGNGFASLLFGCFLGSFSYDRNSDSSQHCYGSHCFALPHLVMAVTCTIGILLSAMIVKRHPKSKEIRRSLSTLSRRSAALASFDISSDAT